MNNEIMTLMNEAARIYKNTHSIYSVSKDMKTPYQKAQKLLVTAGIDLEIEQQKIIMRMVDDGMNQTEIAKKLNFGRNYINSFSPYGKVAYVHAFSEDDSARTENRNKIKYYRLLNKMLQADLAEKMRVS